MPSVCIAVRSTLRWQVDSRKLKQHVRCWVLYVSAMSVEDSTEILTIPICGNVHQC